MSNRRSVGITLGPWNYGAAPCQTFPHPHLISPQLLPKPFFPVTVAKLWFSSFPTFWVFTHHHSVRTLILPPSTFSVLSVDTQVPVLYNGLYSPLLLIFVLIFTLSQLWPLGTPQTCFCVSLTSSLLFCCCFLTSFLLSGTTQRAGLIYPSPGTSHLLSSYQPHVEEKIKKVKLLKLHR